MSSIFESMYKPYFVWEREQVESKTPSDHEDWGEETPALLLSDSEDDTSIPERQPRRKLPLHKQKDETIGGRHVRFLTARIREHSVVLGDLACCSCMPLSLDWNHGKEKVYDINDYETMRQRSGRVERGKLPKLDFAERRRILEEAEWASQNEIDEPPMDPDFDPPSFDDMDQFDTTVEMPEDSDASCNPFALFHDRWSMFGDEACGYPTMTVQVLDD